MKLFVALTYISALSAIIPFGMACFRLKKLETFSKPIVLYVFIALIAEAVGFVFSYLKLNNLLAYHLFTLFEFSLINVFYYKMFSSTVVKWLILVEVLLVAIWAITYLHTNNTYFEFNSLIKGVQCLIFMSLALGLFGQFLADCSINPLQNPPAFWFNVAVIIYASSNLLLFLFLNKNFVDAKRYYYDGWSIHSISNITFNCLIATGLWYSGEKRYSTINEY